MSVSHFLCEYKACVCKNKINLRQKRFFSLKVFTKFANMKLDKDVVSIDISVNDWEKKVVALLADGHSVPEIAPLIRNELRNVEYRIAKLKTRLQCKTSAELVAFFLRNKLIE